MRCKITIALSLALLFFSAFISASSTKKIKSSKAEIAEAVEGNNEFAFDLYARLRKEEGNLIFSPYSISTALAMTYAGARGETARQMEDVLHFTLGQEKLHPALADMVADLNRRGSGDSYELVVANRLWGQKGYKFLDSFLEINSKYYVAGLELVDFVGATEDARQAINTWVEKKTRDKIKELIKKGILTPDVRLVLTNAIYFKGNWASQFNKEDTRDASFALTATSKVNVPMMYQENEFMIGNAEGLQILEMPYVGEELSMVILLPEKLDGLAELEKSLNAAGLKQWLSGMRKQKASVFLPRFKMTSGLNLSRTLVSMGMELPFSCMGADFSGMNGRKDLFISHVIHKAFVEVNEEGTEAAAATAVIMYADSVSYVPVFRADHPFLFLIRDRKTGSILFIGRVADPRG